MKRVCKTGGGLFAIGFLVGVFVFVFVRWAGDLDVVEREYSSKQEAVRDELFERGWLPAFIPESASDLLVRNHLDTNTSEGSFSFQKEEGEAFILELGRRNEGGAQLEELERYRDLVEEGYHLVNCAIERTVWVFLINPDKGHCYYYAGIVR